MMTELITVKEAAELLHVHPQKVRDAINRGELEAYKIGNGYQTTRTFLEAYIAKQKVQVRR